MPLNPLHGVIPPIVTPLNEERRLDVPSTERLCEAMLGWGVHGLFALGTSGEGPFLAPAVRQELIRTVIATTAKRVPVLVGVLAPGTAEVIEQAEFAATAGADALVVTAPYYYAVDQATVRNHFRAVRQAVDLPILAYDIPPTTHVKLSAETVLELAAEGTIVGMKDSSGSMDSLRRVLVRAPREFRIFTGSELQVDAVLQQGGIGVVPGLGNVAADVFAALYNAFQAGDMAAVRSHQERIVRIFDVFLQPGGFLDVAGAIGAMKIALQLRGVIDSTALTLPFAPVTDAAISRVRNILTETHIL